MKTKFATIRLIAGHCDKFAIKFIPCIDMDIDDVIREKHIPTQIPGDFLLDLNSFERFEDGEFSVISVHDGEWVMDANHQAVTDRLYDWAGILRLRIGKMLSFKVGDYFVRVWNFIDDGNKNILDWNISRIGVHIPVNVKRSLMHAAEQREIIQEKRRLKKQQEGSGFPFDVFSLENAFKERGEEWSPSSPAQLHLVEDYDNDVNDFDINSANLDVSTISRYNEKRIARRKKAPKLSDLKTGTK